MSRQTVRARWASVAAWCAAGAWVSASAGAATGRNEQRPAAAVDGATHSNRREPVAASQPATDALRYVIELTDDKPPQLRIRLTVATLDQAASEFAAQPEWGGVEHVEQYVTGVEAHDAAGTRLQVEQDREKPHRWKVAHAPKAVVTVRWRMKTLDESQEFSSNQYRPILRADLLHFIGEVGLIVPGWVDEEVAAPIELAWQGFDRAGWKVVSSFGVGADPMRLQRSLWEFRHGLFLAGRIQVLERTLGDNRLAVAIYGNQWKFDAEPFAELVGRVVGAERDFFEDHSDPFFLVSMIPTKDEGPDSFSFGGTGLTDCFALFCSPQLDLSRRSPHYVRLLHLLAHEYFHTWNGHKIKREEPEALVYWFSEGFTDFYASRLLYQAGLITAKQWLARTNDDLRDYWTSPVRGESAERISADFWKNREVQDLPYKRGSAVALALDWEFRRQSRGARGLDEFMRDVLRRAVSEGEKVSNARLLKRIAEWTTPQFAERIQAVVERGEMLELPADLFSPELAVEQVAMAPYVTGFDVSASSRDRLVSGVQAGGPAAAAGLRDGMKIEAMSIYHGDLTKPITLTVREPRPDGADQTARTIEFMPHGPSVTAPRLKMIAPPKF